MEIKTSWRIPPAALLTAPGIMLSALVLFGGCSWTKSLSGNAKSSPDSPRAHITAIPVMQTQVRMVYPDEIKTLGEAIGYMLEPHAYRMVYREHAGEAVAAGGFAGDYTTTPVSLYVAMQRLLGRDGQILLDEEEKLYAFRKRKPGELSVVFTSLGEPAAGLAGIPPAAAGAKAVSNATANPSGGSAPAVNDAAASTLATHDVAASPPAVSNAAAVNGMPAIHPPVNEETPLADDARRVWFQNGEIPAGNREFCHSIRFRNRTMLSGIVRGYFLKCGFDSVSWKLGEPGRYADYRILRDFDVPLPGGHRDLIEFLKTRFGVRTRIHDNNRVEFHDEKSLP